MNQKLTEIQSLCGQNCQILIVSKKRSIQQILDYYNLGYRDFGENRVSDLIDKANQLPSDIHWHFIGHLQRNKVRHVLPYLSSLQSCDSLQLAEILEKEAQRIDKTLPILIELNLAQEDTKTGLMIEDFLPFVQSCQQLSHLKIQGIMVMGPHVEDTQRIAAVFHQAHQLFLDLKQRLGDQVTICSMGMSQDYLIALRQGSTQLRLGSILFSD